MTPRDLIGMTCCGGVVFQTFTRYGHVFPELATLHPPSWARSGFLAHRTRQWQVRKLLTRKDRDSRYWRPNRPIRPMLF